MKVRRRFLHPIWLLVSLPGYIGWRLLPALSSSFTGILIGNAILFTASAVIPLSVGLRSIANRRVADRIAWMGFVAMGFFSSLFIATLLRDILLTLVTLAISTGALKLSPQFLTST